MNTLHRQVCWSAVFAANLIVPLIFAFSIVHGRAWIGVSLAVAAYWVAGIYVCRKNRTITLSLLIGGATVAVSQFYPILHILAGSIALGRAFRKDHRGLRRLLGHGDHRGRFTDCRHACRPSLCLPEAASGRRRQTARQTAVLRRRDRRVAFGRSLLPSRTGRQAVSARRHCSSVARYSAAVLGGRFNAAR